MERGSVTGMGENQEKKSTTLSKLQFRISDMHQNNLRLPNGCCTCSTSAKKKIQNKTEQKIAMRLWWDEHLQ